MASAKSWSYGDAIMRLMLFILWLVIFSFAWPVASQNLAKQAPTAFAAQLQQVKSQMHNKQWLMLLWSLDCPPCFKELNIVSKLYQHNPNIAVVLVNVDDDPSYFIERQQVIDEFELTALVQLNFAAHSAMENRQLIDKNWHGELPRSYFFAKDGSYKAKSGLVTEPVLTAWLQSK